MNVLPAHQLEGQKWDQALGKLLRAQIKDLIQLSDLYTPEMGAISDTLAAYFSLYKRGKTYGSELVNVEYAGNGPKGQLLPIQKYGHFLFDILGPYAMERIGRLPFDRFKTLKIFSEKLEKVLKLAHLCNYLAFLTRGQFMTLTHRLLNIRAKYTHPILSHQVNFDFMHRQVIWQAFTEFLLFVIPFVNWKRIKSFVNRLSLSNKYITLPESVCAICTERGYTSTQIRNPFKTNCGHVFCYYCIQSCTLADPYYSCLRCRNRVERIAPLKHFE